jgi:hypothetical protein
VTAGYPWLPALDIPRFYEVAWITQRKQLDMAPITYLSVFKAIKGRNKLEKVGG